MLLLDVLVAVGAAVVVVVVVVAVLGLPRHLVLLLEASARVGEPRRHLRQRHLGDDGQHDLLALGRVRVLLVLRQPRLERGRRLARRVLAPRPVQVHAVPVYTRRTTLVWFITVLSPTSLAATTVHLLYSISSLFISLVLVKYLYAVQYINHYSLV